MLCTKLSGACQVCCCFKLACDVTDFEAYTENSRLGANIRARQMSHRIGAKKTENLGLAAAE
jgi:hypothetical protein